MSLILLPNVFDVLMSCVEPKLIFICPQLKVIIFVDNNRDAKTR